MALLRGWVSLLSIRVTQEKDIVEVNHPRSTSCSIAPKDDHLIRSWRVHCRMRLPGKWEVDRVFGDLHPCGRLSNSVCVGENPSVSEYPRGIRTAKDSHAIGCGIIRRTHVRTHGWGSPRGKKLRPYGGPPDAIGIGENPNVIEVSPAIFASKNDKFVARRIIDRAYRSARFWSP